MGKANDSLAQALCSTGLPTELGDSASLLWQEPQQALQIHHAHEHVLRASETGACELPASRSPPSHHIQENFSEEKEQGTEREASNTSCNH